MSVPFVSPTMNLACRLLLASSSSLALGVLLPPPPPPSDTTAGFDLRSGVTAAEDADAAAREAASAVHTMPAARFQDHMDGKLAGYIYSGPTVKIPAAGELCPRRRRHPTWSELLPPPGAKLFTGGYGHKLFHIRQIWIVRLPGSLLHSYELMIYSVFPCSMCTARFSETTTRCTYYSLLLPRLVCMYVFVEQRWTD